MGLILDTSILIAAEKKRLDLAALFAAYNGETFAIAAITAAELLHGVERAKPAGRKKSRSEFVERVLTELEIIDFDFSVAQRHAKIWAALESAGKVIGAYDMLIAATTLHYDFRLATLNIAEFRQVPDLHLVDIGDYLAPKVS